MDLEIAADFIRKEEGLHKLLPNGDIEAYLCPAGIWTIGWGSTQIDGQPVKEGMVISRCQADSQLAKDVARAAEVLSKTVPYWAQMTEYQQAALISFAFNVGFYFMEAAEGFRTIQRVLRNKEWDKVAFALTLYVTDGKGNTLPGLVKRRQKEGLLWMESAADQKQSAIPLHVIVASSETFLYKDPTNPKDQRRVFVPWGKPYSVEKFDQREEYGDYMKVTLAYKAGDWFIKRGDWAI